MAGTHARLSASASHRWMNCSGSVPASEGLDTNSLPGAKGTLAHTLGATCIADPSREAQEFLGLKQKVDGFDVECDQDMVDSINVYVDTVLEDEQEGDKTWIEMPLFAPLQKVDKDTGGTADRVRYRPSTRHLRVFDFKSGSGVYVEADDNSQMKTYALGVMLALAEMGLPVDDVTVTIVQPAYEGARPVRDWNFKGHEILDFVADLQEAAEATRSAPTLVAGEWCKFCPAAAKCPELERKQHALMRVEFGAVVNYTALAMALASIPQVKERIKALEELAYAEALKGARIPGWKLVDKQARRQWKSEADVIEWAQKEGLDPYEPRAVKSPAQLEALIPGGRKKVEREAKQAKLVALNALADKVSSGVALVPESDDRAPATRIAAAVEFPAIPSTSFKLLD